MIFENIFVGEVVNTNGLYILELNDYHIKNFTNKRISETNPNILWHQRLGHIGERRMIQLEESRLLNSLDFEPYLTCE